MSSSGSVPGAPSAEKPRISSDPLTSGRNPHHGKAVGILRINIQAIQFGVDLSVLPRYDRSSGEMEIKINAENNDLSAPGSGTNLPGRAKSLLSTVVHLKLGQSIILSGINTRSQTHGTEGLPLLSEIPIIGFLFGSQRHVAADLEGAVFVIPSVIETLPKASLDSVNAAIDQYSQFSGDMEDVNAFNKTPPVVTERPR